MPKCIGKSLAYGAPGTVSRAIDFVISALPSESDNAIPFGAPIVRGANGGCVMFGSSNTADDFIGVSVAEVKQPTDYNTQEAKYAKNEMVDVLNRGGIMVKCESGSTPVAGGAVHVVKATGAFSTKDDETTVKLSGVIWATGKDADDVAEITVLERRM